MTRPADPAPPSGSPRAWVHLCAAIDGFRRSHDGWPTRVVLPEPELHELREGLLSAESLARVGEKIALEGHAARDALAEDATGRSYRCVPEERPVEAIASIDAEEWLGVRPDRPPHASRT